MRKRQMLAAVIALLAIPAIASAHGGNNDSNMIHACIGNISKIARVVGVGGSCIPGPPLLGETPAHWPRVQGAGPAGPKGDQGDQGAPGVNGTNGIDGTSVTFAGYFDGNQNGCSNGGAIFAAGAVSAYVCNGANGGGGAAARPDGPCFDNTNRYVDCGNGTVTDTVTGLVWLKDANCFGYLDWAGAHGAAAAVANGSCGLTDGSASGDWRLPTKDEWAATIAHAVSMGCIGAAHPSLTNDAGTGCYGDGSTSSLVGVGRSNDLDRESFWSGSTYEISPTLAWGVNVRLGIINTDGLSTGASRKQDGNPIRTWPVRGGSR